jgi:hypothetical protein
MLGAHLMVGQPTDVTLRIAPPPPNMYRMADLWRGDILNASSATYRVYLRAYVDELAPQQQRVVVTRSRTFDLPPGRLQITGMSLEPFTVESYKPEYYDVLIQSGSVPSGDYRGCTEIIDVSTGNVLTTFCNDVVIENASQPFLVAPSLDADVTERYPVFSWMASTPRQSMTKFLYRLQVFEQFATQTPQDAAQRNPAFLDIQGLAQTVYMYPISARNLAVGQRYAWCVTAYLRQGSTLREVGTSEVWSFTQRPPLGMDTAMGLMYQPSISADCPGANWDFETGTLSCWVADGELTEVVPVRLTHAELGAVQQHRDHWLTTYGMQGDGLTGEVRSQVFTISTDRIRVLAGGSRSPDACVELVVEVIDNDSLTGSRRRLSGLTGTFVVVASSYRPDDNVVGDVLQPILWDVSAYQKRRAVLLVRDWSRSAHVNVDDVRFLDSKDSSK